MGKNKKKHLQPSALAEFKIPQTPVENPENHYRISDYKVNFAWSMRHKHYISTSECKKKTLPDFMKETISKLNHYEGMTWAQILNSSKHNHFVKQEQLNAIRHREKIENVLKELRSDVELVQLVGGKSADSHRLFGYIEQDKFFLIINDCNHKQS